MNVWILVVAAREVERVVYGTFNDFRWLNEERWGSVLMRWSAGKYHVIQEKVEGNYDRCGISELEKGLEAM